jgi:hypothetical protein
VGLRTKTTDRHLDQAVESSRDRRSYAFHRFDEDSGPNLDFEILGIVECDPEDPLNPSAFGPPRS